MARITRSKQLNSRGPPPSAEVPINTVQGVAEATQPTITNQNGALNPDHAQAVLGNDDDGPSIKLRDIHPDLHPFLRIPHHIPLLCFFDPNRYAPYNPNAPIPAPPRIPPMTEDSNSAKPKESEKALDDDENSALEDSQMEDGDRPSEDPSALINGPDGDDATSSQMNSVPFFFPNAAQASPSGSRKKRRCLLCIHAGRLNHAYICPGRGNRAVCATVKEIEKAGGTLPAESSKWTSKNTQTPIFVPTPPTMMIYSGSSLTGPISPANQPGIPVAPLETYPIPPPPNVPDPAPLGFLSDGTVRQRRPRRCKVCNAKGRDGTLCIGRAASKRCPYYVAGVDDHIFGAKVSTEDHDAEEMSILLEHGLSTVTSTSDDAE
ncbi:hypothetical protein FRB94_013113 [Tulasnella sp. JGI-2019a]|nr:hypothetical protein FRB94_013113 [Tulasnella sp. JGI-2019a]KAG9000760.1 hypothetical protein FRB93_012586 [Tulasnella sp. JGI-2019a]KAG9030299.1 hypothetical protein FRB95_004131 [Tulasnella sp. JGI-2019a]